MSDFKTWLKGQLSELGMKPTQLASFVDGLNQPTIHRVLNPDKPGGTPNPGIETVRKITEAVKLARQQVGLLPLSDSNSIDESARFDRNVKPTTFGMRAIPVISYIQAGLLTEISDPYSPGQGFATEICEDDLGQFSFALEIEGDSMLPDFRPGDRIIVDPDVTPNPGDFVVAKNGADEATFKKYRPRGTGLDGQPVFELVPLNNDYPTLRSDVDSLKIIGTMVEHRKKFRRKT